MTPRMLLKAVLVVAMSASCGGQRDDRPLPEAGLPLCPGAIEPTRPEHPCRSHEDCGSESICVDPLAGFSGAQIFCPNDCESDDDCDADSVCLPICGSSMMCQPRCTAESCPAGEFCSDDGRCTPAPCDRDDYACHADQVCAPDHPGADGHGCAPASCSSDGFTCPAPAACNEAIGQDSHGCNVPRCDERDEPCPSNFRCDPASEAPDGCVALRCSGDADCDCGACAFGFCRVQPFQCFRQLL
jgi:hypothetical protein